MDEKTRRYLDCLQARLSSRDVNVIKDLGNLCPDNMFSNHQPIKQLGLPTPDEFARSITAQEADLKLKMEKFTKEDTVVVVKDYLRLQKAAPENGDLSHLDANIVSLSQDVEKIVVKLHQSSDVKQLVIEMEKSGKNSGKEELLEFSQLLSTLDGVESECKQLEENPLHTEKDLLKYLQNHGKIFLGVTTNEDLSKLLSYRFQDGDSFYYLYRSNKEANNEEKWILAKLDKDGKASFRYYQIISDQGQGGDIADSHDLKVIAPGNHQTILKSGEKKDHRFYLQSQEGMVIKQKQYGNDLVGSAMLPSGDLIISQVNVNYVSNKTFNQNNFALTQDSVGLESVAASSKSSIWSAYGGIKYYPLKNDWRMSSNVRIYNMVLTYSNDLKGNADARATYLFENNFITVNTDLGRNYSASAGRQFMQGRGSVAATSDFRKCTGVKFIFIVQ